MKKRLNIVLAAACLLASSVYLSGCQKESQKSESTPQQQQHAVVQNTTNAARTSSSSARSDDPQYSFTDVTVSLTDEGRKALLENAQSEIRQTGETSYITVQTGGGTTNPPYDPIICDGMTYSQVWADINQKFQNFLNSTAGHNAKNMANALCRPVGICISNCAVAVIYLIQPDRPCYILAEYLSADRIKAQMVKEMP